MGAAAQRIKERLRIRTRARAAASTLRRARAEPTLSAAFRRLAAERRASSAARPAERSMARLDFDPETLPWLDKPAAEVDRYLEAQAVPDGDRADLRDKLLHWTQFGYATFPGLIDHALIDAYLDDVGELFERREHGTQLQLEGGAPKAIRDMAASELESRHLRVMNFHNASVAGKRIALDARIVSFLGHVFRDTVVAMQTLTFIHGSEQSVHQDYAYVVAPGNPSHLAAAWVALEDSHADAGPLVYLPGSHTIPKFDWGNGLFLTPASTAAEGDFERHILDMCERSGLELKTFLARKGDVFIWHGALAHGGEPMRDEARTRKSLVTHYSSLTAYPFDRRDPSARPVKHSLNGAIAYGDPGCPEDEDVFTRGASL